jgi:hypothetical protein
VADKPKEQGVKRKHHSAYVHDAYSANSKILPKEIHDGVHLHLS